MEWRFLAFLRGPFWANESSEAARGYARPTVRSHHALALPICSTRVIVIAFLDCNLDGAQERFALL